ncbi:MAG: hypothetical protein ACTS8S_11700 [Giesbergeria sp.]
MAAVPSKLGARVTALRRLCADLRQRLRVGQAVQADLAEALGVQALPAYGSSVDGKRPTCK